ncbi:MAG TPA: ABC transporter substrate-binding protein [Usitatibacter sp.]|nr:ABC transporter substrate-binding protein [Usitatibacter sp.]
MTVIPVQTGTQATLAVLLAALALQAGAATFRWSSQGDYLSADPHAQNEGLNNNLNDAVFERLTAWGKKLDLVPSLATSWELKSPTLWRFQLRRGVKFHDGTPFTADDVVFSIERAQLPSSNFKVYATPIGKARAIDAHTVEIETPQPSPLLLDLVNSVRIMSRAWCVKNGAMKPQDFKSGEETFASRNANGTGPYTLVKREAEVATVMRKNPDWWGLREGRGDRRFEGNVDEMVYRPVKSDATRMAALLTGELDLVLDPPLQDIPRLKGDSRMRVVEGPENRVIFLVMDQERDELKYSNVKGKNPFKDLRVRQALYHAIDIEAIRKQVMRGMSLPTGAMVPTAAMSFPAIEPRLAFDPARARRLLAEAGYPDGFELGLTCPNNRYVNDERICTALAAMLAKVGIRVNVSAMPRAQFFQKVDQFDHSMHLYGWGGAATDPGFTLTPVLHSRDGKGRGDFNSGRYRDPVLDRLVESIEVEMDSARRRALTLEAFQRTRENVYAIPLHRQVIPWAVRANVKVVHRADNVIEPLWVQVD